MSESKEVAKHDRAILKQDEHQPIKEVDGFMISVSKYGKFCAEVEGMEIMEETLEAAEDKVHRTYIAHKKKKKAKVDRRCFISGEVGEYWNPKPVNTVGWFRGVHAGNGDILFRLPDGTKGRSRSLILFAPEDPKVEDLMVLLKREEELEAELEEVRGERKAITESQQKKMWAELEYGYGTIRNDAGKAFKYTAAIMRNLFEVEIDGEEPSED